MDKSQVLQFIAKQKTVIIGSVDEQGHPVMRAMLAPRKIEGDCLYFSTNTSSKKVAQYTADAKASVYCYQRGLVRYRGVCVVGTMEVCCDSATKEAIWRTGDRIFYKQGVTDPDYSVLKFRCERAEYYCDMTTQTILF